MALVGVIYVIALTTPKAVQKCLDEGLNPRSGFVVLVATDEQSAYGNLRGRIWNTGDQILKDWEWAKGRYVEQVAEQFSVIGAPPI